jgi:hypothetical protein
MLAGAHYGLESLPRRWQDALEDTSRQACRKQALALLELSLRTGSPA